VSLVLIGISHHTAPVGVRERHAIPAGAAVGLAEKLVRHDELAEAAILSTCNRTELLVVASDAGAAGERLLGFLSDTLGDGTLDRRHVYELRERDAVRHLLRVASSLDAMVLGEAQILGQLKDAHRDSVAARACGPILNRLFQRAFRTAKRVRSETGLGAGSISVARVGVQLAREVFESFEGKAALLIGAGEMAESALHGLREAGVAAPVVVNRSPEPAERLAARLGGRAAPLTALGEELARADVALASIASERPLLDRELLERAMASRAGRPLLLIDLGVPRNVDPEANRLHDVYLYDLDDLEEIAERGRTGRSAEIPRAERIVEEECDHFLRWRAGLAAVPDIRALIERAEAIAAREAERRAARLGGEPETRAALAGLARAIVAKLLHEPLSRLRAEAEEEAGGYYAAALRELFGLEEEDE
jgi:glutamyl-tRNA reductase